MNIATAIILGIVQGATEFLPVSSSGHLVIFAKILRVESSFEFDVLVNFGTLFAMLYYFRVRVGQIIKDVVVARQWNTAGRLVIATIPAVAVGFFGQDFISTHLHSTWVAVVMLLAIGVGMIYSQRWQVNKALAVNKNEDVREMSTRHAVFIGLAQCLSLISGASRSGTTILAGLKIGINRERAAEWSFMMGVPIIFGASMKVLLSEDGQQYIQNYPVEFIVSNITSFVSGVIAVTVFMKILQKHGLHWFGWYRIVLAAVLTVLLSVNIL
jgi:undecaprenyl-diphosphatase